MLRVPVLVAGGGPVGLTLSILLSGYGVDHLVVEARPDTSRHPKARGVAARTMEIFRRCGLEKAVRDAGLPPDQVAFFRGRSLVDPDFTRTTPPPAESPHTPSPGLICAQNLLEPVLAAAAGDRVRFGTRLVSYVDDGVIRAELSDGTTVEADWLIGCDGAGSAVRAAASIEMDGPAGLGYFVSVRFDAPLGDVVADRASASYFLEPITKGGFMAVDNDREWIYQLPLDPAGDRQLPDLVATIRDAAGIPDLDVTVRDTLPWRMDAQLAQSYRRGHVLLAGDAAHLTPPTGGHGMNTGIGDADNLAWKLAAVVQGRAGDALLDTYESERRPIAGQVIDISLANARQAGGYRMDDELLLTASYAGGSGSLQADGYRPGGEPGRRVPHVTLPDGSSTLDLVGPGSTLLVTTNEEACVRKPAT
jgi:2-polyprenyl-6-methoxyphenol hydroxylase-like FAD-dependent oxidoreductase